MYVGGYIPHVNSDQRAALELVKLKQAVKIGEGPIRLSEKRALSKTKRQRENETKREHDIEALTFSNF